MDLDFGLGPGLAEIGRQATPARAKNLRKLLNKAGLTIDDVMAEALAASLDPFERFDRMAASSEARRNNALREIDRHREALGAAMRRALDEVQDAEFRDVETGATNGGASV